MDLQNHIPENVNHTDAYEFLAFTKNEKVKKVFAKLGSLEGIINTKKQVDEKD